MTEQQLFMPVKGLRDTRVVHEFLAQNGPEGPELLRAIVETYLNETPPVVESLGDALARADYSAAAWLAHRLKGRCVGIGASQLAAQCARLEELCRSVAQSPMTAYSILVADFAVTTHTFRAFLSELA